MSERKLYGAIQDVMMEALDSAEGKMLPLEFTIHLEPDSLKALLGEMVDINTGEPAHLDLKVVYMDLFGHRVTVVADGTPVPRLVS